MEDFIHRLPDDIVRHIIPFTYQPQKQELLNEIRMYRKSKIIPKEFWFGGELAFAIIPLHMYLQYHN
jgi:hypothetical protein